MNGWTLLYTLSVPQIPFADSPLYEVVCSYIYFQLLSLLVSPKVQPFADVCNHRFTMASADFSPFVVTHGLHTLFSSADETSLGTTRHFLSIYLPHLLQLIPSSYWTLVCLATLSLTIAWCDFCSSDQRFASTFLQIPLTLIIATLWIGHPWSWLYPSHY